MHSAGNPVGTGCRARRPDQAGAAAFDEALPPDFGELPEDDDDEDDDELSDDELSDDDDFVDADFDESELDAFDSEADEESVVDPDDELDGAPARESVR